MCGFKELDKDIVVGFAVEIVCKAVTVLLTRVLITDGLYVPSKVGIDGVFPAIVPFSALDRCASLGQLGKYLFLKVALGKLYHRAVVYHGNKFDFFCFRVVTGGQKLIPAIVFVVIFTEGGV